MAYHFSANQFEHQYGSKRLNNWELPKCYPTRPRARRGSSKAIANDNGHLLPNVTRSGKGPWSNFRSTYQLPDKLTRKFGDEYNDCISGRDKWKARSALLPKQYSCEDNGRGGNGLGVTGTACDITCKTAERALSADKEQTRILHPCEKSKKSIDFEYVPGDFTPPQLQHESRQHLLQQKYERDNGIEPQLPLDKLYLGHHDEACGDKKLDVIRDTYKPPLLPAPSLLPTTTAFTDSIGPSLHTTLEPYERDTGTAALAAATATATAAADFDATGKMPLIPITGKPNERCPSPVVPAYANFELARRMHQDNLDHQPLPDCVADAAFRRLQIAGGQSGLALDLDPIATGVGIRTHNAGPTHCTKMKVFRPSTCGVVPKAYGGAVSDLYRDMDSAALPGKKMGAMDLAIGWDYRPANPADEPLRPAHIDGSQETAGPAVFNYVKSPREDAPATTGRSAGVFASTLGETDFFDKDIMRRNTDFGGRNIAQDDPCGCGDTALPLRARSVSRDRLDMAAPAHLPARLALGKQYQSTPNVMSDQAYQQLRDKYLTGNNNNCRVQATGEPACRRGFFRRATRPCHKVAPAVQPAGGACCHLDTHMPPPPRCKPAAFRAGLPRYDAGGNMLSSDSGCSGFSNHAHRVLVVPRPKIPYAKRNYDIDTLVPPFRSSAGGATEGGYPEHWRLASVYQHAYKPPQLRRRPLLQTVYK